MSGDGKKKGGSHGMRGKNIGSQLRALFAKGVLRRGGGKGKGGKGKVVYTKAPNVTHARNTGVRQAKAGFSRHNHNTNAAKSNAYGNGRMTIGAKAAHLRGSGTGGKVDHSATRAARIAAGEKRLKTLGLEPSKKANNPGLQGKYGAEQRALSIDRLRSSVRNTTTYERQAKAERKAQETFKTLGQSGAGKSRAERLAAGRARLEAFSETVKGQRANDSLMSAAGVMKKLGKLPSADAPFLRREANRFRLKREKAAKTLQAVKEAQRFTYNGFKGDPKRRYAVLKNRERMLRAMFGL